MGVLVHRTPEKFVQLLEFLDERSGGNGSLVTRVLGNVYEKGPEGGRKRPGGGRYKRAG